MKHQLLSEIIKEVNEKGYHYVPLDSLKPVFGCVGDHDMCVEEKLLVWAIKNQIYFELKRLGPYKVVRFLRRGR